MLALLTTWWQYLYENHSPVNMPELGRLADAASINPEPGRPVLANTGLFTGSL